jgi:hypothetical protein
MVVKQRRLRASPLKGREPRDWRSLITSRAFNVHMTLAFGSHEAVVHQSRTGGATENKEDKNLYKQVIRLLKN